MDVLRFQAINSAVDTTFWAELQRLKLGELRLSERPLALQGWLQASSDPTMAPALRVDQSSLQPDATCKTQGQQQGTIMNTNTKESFAAFEGAAARKEVIQQTAANIWAAIRDGSALRNPTLLHRFLLLTFADLKRYHFHYMFAFVALEPPEAFKSVPAVTLDHAFGADRAAEVAVACGSASPDQPFWLLHLRSGQAPERHPLSSWAELLAASSPSETAFSNGQAASDGRERADEVLLGWADPGSSPENPAWPLRNALLLAAKAVGVRRLRVVCARTRGGVVNASASLLLDVSLPEVPPEWCAGEGIVPKARGWENNRSGKPGTRQVDLGAAMDPHRLMENAVDLNLKLMLWRAAPSLDLPALAATRCLLLGAGTLGCAVARTLLGWGVRHITFLDSGRVSYSNPVRQCLYEFEDCQGEGKPKAQAAADALRRIFPSVITEGVQVMVPMPGHPIAAGEEEGVQRDAEALEALVRRHDCVFLLMDTRESRWLPSLLCASAGVLAINAALGFDSYLVMRHGSPPLPPLPHPDLARSPAKSTSTRQDDGALCVPSAAARDPHSMSAAVQEVDGDSVQSELAAASASTAGHPSSQAVQIPKTRVGCYYCQDVVAPLDSTAGRALDQQCTVARPGLAPLAGALAVEMLAAVVQERSTGSTEALGEAPHMVRGQLAGAQQTVLRGDAFSQCTACSPAVVSALRSGGWPFLLEALREPKRLEDLTGLTAMHAAAEALEDFAFQDSDDDGAASDADEWTTL